MAPTSRVATHREPHRFPIPLPRPLWLGLAAVLLLVAAAGLRFGVPVYWRHIAVREILAAGGEIETRRSAPQWLRTWMGRPRMYLVEDVNSVSLFEPRVAGTALVHIAWLNRLERLEIACVRFGDDGMARLKEMKKLRFLFLEDTGVTDAGLVHLKDLSMLRDLDLSHTQVTDAGLVHLKGMTGIRGLTVYGTKVTAAGVADLKRALPNLTIYGDPSVT